MYYFVWMKTVDTKITKAIYRWLFILLLSYTAARSVYVLLGYTAEPPRQPKIFYVFLLLGVVIIMLCFSIPAFIKKKREHN